MRKEGLHLVFHQHQSFIYGKADVFSLMTQTLDTLVFQLIFQMVKQEAEHNSQGQDDATEEKQGDSVGEPDFSESMPDYHLSSFGSIVGCQAYKRPIVRPDYIVVACMRSQRKICSPILASTTQIKVSVKRVQIPVLAYLLVRIPGDDPIVIRVIPGIPSATLPYICQGGGKNSIVGVIAEKLRFDSTDIRYGL
jgi:hypothetical protein